MGWPYRTATVLISQRLHSYGAGWIQTGWRCRNDMIHRAFWDEHAVSDPDQTVQRATAALAEGRPAVVADAVRDIGVVGLAGRHVDAEDVNFMIKECRGILYAALSDDRLDELGIGRPWGSDVMRSYVYVAVDAIEGVTTGISAADRARTIRALVDPTSTRNDFRSPGHVVPAAIDMSGELSRFYLTESVQRLVSMAGQGHGVALAAVLNSAGDMASVGELQQFAAEHSLPLVTVADVVRAHRAQEGWPRPWPGTESISLVHLRRTVAIRARDVHQPRERISIALLELCLDGHVLGAPGACRDRLDAAITAFEQGGLDIVAVTRDTSADDDNHECGRTNPWVPALADLLAADLAAAVAALQIGTSDGPRRGRP